MNTEMELSDKNICRLCLSKAGTLEDIFDSSVIKIPHKIYVCTNLQVEADDECSNLICGACKLKLFDAYQFRIDCIRSNTLLKKYITNSKIKIQSVGHRLYRKSKSKLHKEQAPRMLTVNSVNIEIKQSPNSGQPPKFVKCQRLEEVSSVKEATKLPAKRHSSRIRFKSKFKNRMAIKTHSDVPNEKCDICGKTFKSIGYLSHHMRVHNGLKPYRCKICRKTFSQNSSLVVHLRQHSGDKPYICNLCGKGFTQSGNLAVHHRSHTGERPFQCDICAKSFSQIGNLYIHKRIHTGERQYVCEMCDKAFKFPSHLAEHARIHSTDKQFHCSICDKGFHKSSYLSTHIRIHTGEKPYKCDHCGKSFSNSSNLAAHIRIHTGSKPYVCTYCSKGFAQSSAQVRHIKLHKKQIEKCEKEISKPKKSAVSNLHKIKTELSTCNASEDRKKSKSCLVLVDSNVDMDSLYKHDMQPDTIAIRENRNAIESIIDNRNISVLKRCHVKSAPSAKYFSDTDMTSNSQNQDCKIIRSIEIVPRVIESVPQLFTFQPISEDGNIGAYKVYQVSGSNEATVMYETVPGLPCRLQNNYQIIKNQKNTGSHWKNDIVSTSKTPNYTEHRLEDDSMVENNIRLKATPCVFQSTSFGNGVQTLNYEIVNSDFKGNEENVINFVQSGDNLNAGNFV